MVLCRFAVGRIVPLELVSSVAGGDVHFVVLPPLRQREGEVFAVGIKLRRVGPIAFASAAYCIVELRRQPWGEAFAVAGRRDAAVVWAEGLHSGWNARMIGWGSCRGRQTLRSVPLMKFFLFAIHAPLLGGSTGPPFVVVADTDACRLIGGESGGGKERESPDSDLHSSLLLGSGGRRASSLRQGEPERGDLFLGGLLCAGQGTCDATGDAWKGERTRWGRAVK